MQFDRRDFFLRVPAGLAGLSFLADAAAPQVQTTVSADPAAVHFWTKKMGVSAQVLPKAGATRGANGVNGLAPGEDDTDNEPFFFYFDKNTGLVPADKLTTEHLDGNSSKGPDAKVTFTKKHLRFGEGDQKTFRKYSSCGLYLETQQHPSAASSDYGSMGWGLLAPSCPHWPKPSLTERR